MGFTWTKRRAAPWGRFFILAIVQAPLSQQFTSCSRTKPERFQSNLTFSSNLHLHATEQDTYRYFFVDNYLKDALDAVLGLFFIDTQRFERLFM